MVNSQKVGSASDSADRQGNIGLVASAYNNVATVTYRNAGGMNNVSRETSGHRGLPVCKNATRT